MGTDIYLLPLVRIVYLFYKFLKMETIAKQNFKH